MRKKVIACIALGALCISIFTGCNHGSDENPSASSGSEQSKDVAVENKDSDIAQNEQNQVENNPMIFSEGTTLETRFATPEGYKRTSAEESSLTVFLRGYALKDYGSPVLLFDGDDKRNQSAHAAVFTLPINDVDLQQCADSVMRIWAESYWSKGEYDKIAFHFTNGFLCEYSKWVEGYRVAIDGNDVYWTQSASYDDSYENFEDYLLKVFSYAGTLSMDSYESDTINLADMEVGDIIIKGGSPGHVVMVVDSCENAAGEKAFLLAQGYMPAQEFHVIKNPAHAKDPWYYESEMTFPLRTAEYTFDDENMIKRLIY